jgi:hypothetical protein
LPMTQTVLNHAKCLKTSKKLVKMALADVFIAYDAIKYIVNLN